MRSIGTVGLIPSIFSMIPTFRDPIGNSSSIRTSWGEPIRLSGKFPKRFGLSTACPGWEGGSFRSGATNPPHGGDTTEPFSDQPFDRNIGDVHPPYGG